MKTNSIRLTHKTWKVKILPLLRQLAEVKLPLSNRWMFKGSKITSILSIKNSNLTLIYSNQLFSMRAMRKTLFVDVSLTFLFVLVKSIVLLLLRRLICSKCTQAFTWDHFKLHSRQRN